MRSLSVVLLLVSGCFQAVPLNAATEPDGGVAADAGYVVDGANDASVACECDSGDCCDGCRFLARFVLCGHELERHASCASTPTGTQVLTARFYGQCSGKSHDCGPNLGIATTTVEPCNPARPCDVAASEPTCP